ncbi:hypothetical protein G6F43_012251 [Rhizopus delemar]|nr:hypothetical protein G6F43_012251 [Rhizopus delemar]
MFPVAVVVGIHSTTSGCTATGWTQEPYSISAETISLYLDQHPLHPFNALGHFLIEQKLSISDIEKIQRLNCCTGLPHVYSEMKLPMKKQNKTPLTSFAASQRRNSTEQCHPCRKTFVSLKLKKEQGAVFSILTINDWQWMNDYRKENGLGCACDEAVQKHGSIPQIHVATLAKQRRRDVGGYLPMVQKRALAMIPLWPPSLSRSN